MRKNGMVISSVFYYVIVVGVGGEAFCFIQLESYNTFSLFF